MLPMPSWRVFVLLIIILRLSHAQLSVARVRLAGAQVRDVAIFAGGVYGPFLEVLRLIRCRRNTTGSAVARVDIWNGTARAWTFGDRLSVARASLAAASVGSVALFAGGQCVSSRALSKSALWL